MKGVDSAVMVNYIRSVDNEICIDKAAYELCGIEPASVGNMPRPAKFLKYINGRKRLFGLGANFFNFMWVPVGATLFFLREWLRFRFYMRRVIRQPVSGVSSVIALCSSDRCVEVIKAAKKMPGVAWITFPWAQVDLGGTGEQVVDVFSLLDKRDLKRALKLSMRAVYVLWRRQETRAWTLEGYTAFRWFCVRLALEKLDFDHLLTADHFDRWAVLADGIVSRKRLRQKNINGVIPEWTLIQHGEVRSLSQPLFDDARLPYSLSYKLNAVSQLIVFDDYSRRVFENDVFSKRCLEKNMDVQMFVPEIKLVSLMSEYNITILFVGHPICEMTQIEFYKSISSNFNVSVYYKPHPTAGMSHLVSAQGWTIISDKRFFPKVSILISYPSTLVHEYEAQGVAAVVHPLQHDEALCASALYEVQSQLRGMGCEKY